MSYEEKIKQVFENYYKMNKTTRAFDELYQDVLKILEDHNKITSLTKRKPSIKTAKLMAEGYKDSANDDLALTKEFEEKFVVVEKQKLEELADLMKDRPFIDERTNLGQNVVIKWVRNLEKKFAELGLAIK